MTNKQAAEIVKHRLSEKRYRHVKNVAAAARELAICHGEDPDMAELAGWLHDVVKECSEGELLQLMAQDDIMAGSTKQRPFPIWHGPCGAIYAKHFLGVNNKEVLDAIACHTTGRVGMTTMDKILFLADATSAERSFPGVAEIRALAKTDINAAVIDSMLENINYLNRRGKPLDNDTVLALEALQQETGKCNKLELVL